MVRIVSLVGIAIVLVATGCKDKGGTFADAGIPDATPIDATTEPDAAPPAPGQELTSGGGRMTGPSYVLDVQVGHPIPQRPLSGPNTALEGNAPVKP